MATLRDYIGYARKFIHPSLSEEAGQTLVDAYVSECLHVVYHVTHRVIVQVCVRLVAAMGQ